MIKDNNNTKSTDTMDAALLAFLQSELLVLSNETRRKQPDLKLAIDAVLQDLRAAPTSIQAVLLERKLVDILGKSVAGPSKARCLPSVVSVILRLVNQCPGAIDDIQAALRILQQAVMTPSEKEGGGEDVHLKCLQCAIPVWQKWGQSDAVVVYLMLSVCFKLCTATGAMASAKEWRHQQSVVNAAMAITRQLVIYLFESFVFEDCNVFEDCSVLDGGSVLDGNVSREHGKPAEMNILQSVLHAICQWMYGEQAGLGEGGDAMAKGTLQPSPAFCVELFESLLTGQSARMRHSPETITIIREQVCPFVVRHLDDPHDFNLAVRLWRFVVVVLTEGAEQMPLECEIFLSFMTRVLEDRETDCSVLRLLVLETIELVLGGGCSVVDRLCSLSGSMAYDGALGSVTPSGSPAFGDTIRSLFRFTLNEVTDTGIATIGSMTASGTSGTGSQKKLVYEQSSLRVALLSSFERSAPATIPPHYALFLSLKCLYALTMVIQDHRHNTIVATCGRLMAEIMDRMCGLQLDKLWLSNAMDLFERWLVACDQCPVALSAGLSSLCLVGANCQSQGDIPVVAAKTCLRVSEKVNDALGVADWSAVVPVICGCYGDGDSGNRQAVDTLLSASISFSDQSHLALHTATVSIIQSATDPTHLSNLAKVLQDLCAYNLTRFPTPGAEAAWLELAVGLRVLLTRGIPSIAAIACAIAAQVTSKYMETVCTTAGADTQVLGLHVLKQIASIPEASQCVMECLHQVVALHGQAFGDTCWALCYDILNDNLAHPTAIRSVFNCARLVGSDYHGTLSPMALALHISLLGRLCRPHHIIVDQNLTPSKHHTTSQPHASQTQEDLNISLSAISSLWDCADAVVTKKWWPQWRLVLKQLVQSASDARCEVRNGAVQTVFRMVQVHGNGLQGGGEWLVVFEEIVGPLCCVVDEQYASSASSASGTWDQPLPGAMTHHTRDTAKKQWDETMVLVLRGLTDIFIQHHALIDARLWRSVLIGRLARTIVGGGMAAELVAVSWQCVVQLLQQCQLTVGEWAEKWEPLWRTVAIEGSLTGMTVNRDCFDQSTLVNVIVVLRGLLTAFSDCIVKDTADSRQDTADSRERVDSVFEVVKAAIAHPPALMDRVHDRDNMNELQKAVTSLLHSDTLDRLFTGHLYCRVSVLRWMADMLQGVKPDDTVDLVTCLTGWAVRMRPQPLPLVGGDQQVRDYTRVAFYVSSLHFLTAKSQWFSDDASVGLLWSEGVLRDVISALAHWCTALKYKAPSRASKDLAVPWIAAQQTLLSVLKSCNQSKIYGEPRFCEAEAEALGAVLERAGESVPVDIDPVELERDEGVDLELVPFVEAVIGDPRTPPTSQTILLATLQAASSLYNLTVDSTNVMTAPAVALDNTERIVKSTLAAACLQSLFKLEPARLYLRDRVTMALVGFLEAQRLLGSMPAPQYHFFIFVSFTRVTDDGRSRREEVEFMLSKMLDSDNQELIRACYPHLIGLLTTPAVPSGIVKMATALLLLITPSVE